MGTFLSIIFDVRCLRPRSRLWWSRWYIPRLDYGNAVLAGLPAYLQRCLQSVLNAAPCLIYRLVFRDRITDALICLHWLRVPQRFEFQLAVLTYKFLFIQALRYFGPLVHVADLLGQRDLCSANTDRYLDTLSGAASRHIFFSDPFRTSLRHLSGPCNSFVFYVGHYKKFRLD